MFRFSTSRTQLLLLTLISDLKHSQKHGPRSTEAQSQCQDRQGIEPDQCPQPTAKVHLQALQSPLTLLCPVLLLLAAIASWNIFISADSLCLAFVLLKCPLRHFPIIHMDGLMKGDTSNSLGSRSKRCSDLNNLLSGSR